jgi:hypothetical protein
MLNQRSATAFLTGPTRQRPRAHTTGAHAVRAQAFRFVKFPLLGHYAVSWHWPRTADLGAWERIRPAAFAAHDRGNCNREEGVKVKSLLCSIALFGALAAPAAAFDRFVAIGAQGHGADTTKSGATQMAYDDALSTLQHRCTDPSDMGGIRFDPSVVGNFRLGQTDGGWRVSLDMSGICVIPQWRPY